MIRLPRTKLAKMRPYIVASAVEADGWVVITFGQDYFSWSDRQTEGIVTAYANSDACVTGQARSLEFDSHQENWLLVPTGSVASK